MAGEMDLPKPSTSIADRNGKFFYFGLKGMSYATVRVVFIV
jgi:hypothetical protein